MRERLRALAATRRRFGFRRLGNLLDREGLGANHKKVFRIYQEEGLAVKRQRGRKRAVGTRSPMRIPNQRWGPDRLRLSRTERWQGGAWSMTSHVRPWQRLSMFRCRASASPGTSPV